MAKYPVIVRGTTPTHTFNIPVDAELVEEICITYSQNDKEIFTRETYDCEVVGNQISTTLTQANTRALNHKLICAIQCFFKTTDGLVYGSDSNYVKVMNGLNKEI